MSDLSLLDSRVLERFNMKTKVHERYVVVGKKAYMELKTKRRYKRADNPPIEIKGDNLDKYFGAERHRKIRSERKMTSYHAYAIYVIPSFSEAPAPTRKR